MAAVEATALPTGALLEAYARADAYTDCYAVSLPRAVSLAEFIAAFYTTPVFRLERWLLARTLRLPSTDRDALALAQGQSGTFAAWQVETREANQVVLAAGRTRSWLMVGPRSSGTGDATTLFFGSAIVPRGRGALGWRYGALLGFHKLYSRVLLGAAARRLAESGA